MIRASRPTAAWMKRIDSSMSRSMSCMPRRRTGSGTSSRRNSSRRSRHDRLSSSLKPWRFTSGERRSCETL